MISCYNDIYSPFVTHEIDIYDFIEQIRNPGKELSHKIWIARLIQFTKGKDEYNKIKGTLPCFTLNFNFDKYKSNSTLKAPTGFIYLDLDGPCISKPYHPLIFASWKSLSNNGYGILVKVDGLTLDNFKFNYSTISKEINLPTDKVAAKATQYTVLSLDSDIYVNNDSVLWKAITPSPSTLKTNKKRERINPERGVKTPLKYDNLDQIDFKDRDYIEFPGNKLITAKLYIPKIIHKGSRNQYLYNLGYQLRALNKHINNSRFTAIIHGINSSCCEEPLEVHEVNRIIAHLLNIDEIEPILNAPRRVIFNPKSTLSRTKKQTIVNKLTGRLRSKKTLTQLVNAVHNWDYWINGRITQKKLKEATGKNIKTIEKYYKELKDF